MKDNGTDRDVALQLLDKLTLTASLVTGIDRALKSEPYVIIQPKSVTGEVGDIAVFSLKTNKVKSYQWQAKATTQWNNAQDGEGYTTDTFSLEITSVRYGRQFRCKITGLDDSVIYSDIVTMIKP